jgi:GTPase SAR1 family protein
MINLGNYRNWFSFQNYVLRGSNCTITIMVKIYLRYNCIRMFDFIRDTAGQERFRLIDDIFIRNFIYFFSFCRSLIPSYIRDSTVAVVVYDITSKYKWFVRYLNQLINFKIPIHFNKHQNGLMMFVRNVVVMLS